jgi:hypothetical protein
LTSPITCQESAMHEALNMMIQIEPFYSGFTFASREEKDQ